MKTMRILAVAALAGLLAAQTTTPGNIKAPVVKTGTTTTSIYWTAETLENGGHTVAVVAGSAALGASKTDCTSPNFAACDILFANSSGTVAVTTTIGTATAAGDTIMAYIETSAGSVPTNIVTPLQSGALWTNSGVSGVVAAIASAQYCGTTNTCAATSLGSTAIIVTGITANLDAASPSKAAVTGINPAFTSATSYACVGNLQGTTAALAADGVAVTNVSGSAVTFYSANGAAVPVHYVCVGY